MADFYKGEKNIVFKLKDLEVVEDFKLWQGWKQELSEAESLAQYKVVLQFPIREGQLPGVDGTPRDVQTVIKFMKRADFMVQYPKLGKRTQYIRNIIIGGIEYRYGFSKTSNDKLNAMLALTPGQIPNVFFQQVFDKNKSASAMYDVIVAEAGKVGPVTPPVTPTQPVVPLTSNSNPPQAVSPTPSPPASSPPASVGGLSDGEKTILAGIKGLATKLTQGQFIKVFSKNLVKPEYGGITANVASQRALAVYDSNYK